MLTLPHCELVKVSMRPFVGGQTRQAHGKDFSALLARNPNSSIATSNSPFTLNVEWAARLALCNQPVCLWHTKHASNGSCPSASLQAASESWSLSCYAGHLIFNAVECSMPPFRKAITHSAFEYFKRLTVRRACGIESYLAI